MYPNHLRGKSTMLKIEDSFNKLSLLITISYHMSEEWAKTVILKVSALKIFLRFALTNPTILQVG